MSKRAEASGAALWGDADDSEARERYRTLVNAIEDGVFRLDAAGEVVAVNDAAVELTGYEREDLLGERLAALLDGEDGSTIGDAVDRVRSNPGDGSRLESALVTADGDRVPCELRLNAVESDGASPEAVGVLRTVTGRERVRERLEEERDVFATGPTVVFRWRNEEGWPVERVSENVEELLGYAPESLESGEVPYTDLLVEEEIDRIAREVETNSEDGAERFSHDPYRVKTADGDVRWVEDVTKIVRDESGDVTHYVGYLVDVTERKRREGKLQARSAAMAESIEGMAILNEDAEYEFVNRAHAEIYGYDDPDAFLGETWRTCYDDGEVERLEEEAMPALFDEGSWRGEAVGLRADGTTFPQEVSLTALDDGRLICVVRDITERKERERELRRKERRYQAVFEDPNILVGLLEPDGTVLDINRTAMEYVDADLDAVTGEPFWETPWWGEGDDVRSDVREWTERAAAGEYVDFEADLTRPNGDRYVLSGYFRPVTDDDGEVVSVIVSDRDVTERREYQRELEESERRYRTLAENFPNGAVALVDDDLTYRTVGGNPLEVADVTADEAEGRPVGEALPADLADELVPRYEAALDGESGSFEIELEDGIYEFRIEPVSDENGEVFAALGMSQDVTERTEYERELAKYEAIVETVEDGIYVKDEDGRFTMVNEAYAELTGYDRDELIGAHASLVVDEDVVERSRETLDGTDDGSGSSEAVEAPIETADGDAVPAEAVFSTLRTGDGERKEVGVVRDVTERREQRRRIEESERRYRTLVENFPDGAVGLFDEDLRYTAVGGQLVDELGLSPDDRVGRHVREVHTQEILAEVEPHFRAALDGEANSFEIEYRGRYLFAHTLPVRDGDDVVFAGMLVVQDVTERREAERELRESEARFRMLAENLEEVVWMATADAEEFLYVNPAFEEVWAMDRERLYDEPLSFLEAVHPDDRERVREEFAALPDEEFDEEFRVVRSDGEVRWVRARGARVSAEGGETVRVVGIGEDVTERVERERRLDEKVAELEESEERLRLALRAGEMGTWELDVQTGDVPVRSPEHDRIFGYDDPLDEWSYERFLEHVHPEDRERVERSFERAFETGNWTFECRIERADGAERVISAQGKFYYDDRGRAVRAVGVVRDVTERTERERELERALDLLERTERIADVGGWEIDPRTQDVFWTDHVFDLLEVDAEEEPPLDEALDMYHEEDQPLVEAAVERALETGESFDVEVRLRTGSGDVRWLRLQGAPETVDGEVTSFRGAAQDVTERKRREQRLEELIDRLEESNERLEQFAYAASHDLQEPLRMVSSYLQLIERRYGDDLDEDGEEFLEYAVDGADRMRNMIQGLLDYSRVETRGDPFEPVDLSAVVDDVRKDLEVTIAESDAEVDVGSLPRVRGDAEQLNQVFQNLLTNAIEYSGDEPPRIDVSAERAGEEWVVAVSDAGVGIDPEDADRVFEVFQSLHGPEEHSGTGIGLALCERIVERHGGEIWVDSEPGEGSTFSFTLPAVDEAE